MSSSDNASNINSEINWSDVIKREARGIDDADFGEVQGIGLHYILTEKGVINKDTFYLPKELVEGFDGDKLRFSISEGEAEEKFKRDTAPSPEEYSVFKKKLIAPIDKNQDKNNAISNSLETEVQVSQVENIEVKTAQKENLTEKQNYKPKKEEEEENESLDKGDEKLRKEEEK